MREDGRTSWGAVGIRQVIDRGSLVRRPGSPCWSSRPAIHFPSYRFCAFADLHVIVGGEGRVAKAAGLTNPPLQSGKKNETKRHCTDETLTHQLRSLASRTGTGEIKKNR